MNTFSLQELYEISDALTERRRRLLGLSNNLYGGSKTAERMMASCASAHDKVTNEIINRTGTL